MRSVFLFFLLSVTGLGCDYLQRKKVTAVQSSEVSKFGACGKPTRLIFRGEKHTLARENWSRSKIERELRSGQNKGLISLDEYHHFRLEGLDGSPSEIGLETAEVKEAAAGILLGWLAQQVYQDSIDGVAWGLVASARLQFKPNHLVNQYSEVVWEPLWKELPGTFRDAVQSLDFDNPEASKEQAKAIVLKDRKSFSGYARSLSQKILSIPEISSFLRSTPQLNADVQAGHWRAALRKINHLRELAMARNITLALKTFAADTCKDFFVRLGGNHLERVADMVVRDIGLGTLHPLKIKLEASYSPEIRSLYSSSKYHRSSSNSEGWRDR